MVDIIVDPDALSKSKVHPIDIERARKKMLKNPDIGKHRAKRRWVEKVYVEESGITLAVNCHKENDLVVMEGIRKLTKRKPVGPPRRRR